MLNCQRVSLLQRGSIKLGMATESNHDESPVKPVYCRPRIGGFNPKYAIETCSSSPLPWRKSAEHPNTRQFRAKSMEKNTTFVNNGHPWTKEPFPNHQLVESQLPLASVKAVSQWTSGKCINIMFFFSKSKCWANNQWFYGGHFCLVSRA